VEAAVDYDELSFDGQVAGAFVEVAPVQAGGFAAAQAEVGQEVEQRVVGVGGGVVEKSTGEFGGPDHDGAGGVAGAVPVGDAFVGPQQGFGWCGGVEFDVRGGVVVDVAAVECGVQRSA